MDSDFDDIIEISGGGGGSESVLLENYKIQVEDTNYSYDETTKVLTLDTPYILPHPNSGDIIICMQSFWKSSTDSISDKIFSIGGNSVQGVVSCGSYDSICNLGLERFYFGKSGSSLFQIKALAITEPFNVESSNISELETETIDSIIDANNRGFSYDAENYSLYCNSKNLSVYDSFIKDVYGILITFNLSKGYTIEDTEQVNSLTIELGSSVYVGSV